MTNNDRAEDDRALASTYDASTTNTTAQDFWAERDRRYEQFRSAGYGPSHAQDLTDGSTLYPGHDPKTCPSCLNEN
jgi:hypothetical protein